MHPPDDRPDHPREPRELISALADGEADAGDSTQALQAIADDDEALGRWHAYHLIGDVLRSGDLAAVPAHDRRFLDAVRSRLAEQRDEQWDEQWQEQRDGQRGETVSPAATGLPAATRSRPRWSWPVALAAGVAALATALVVLRLPAGGDGAAAQVAAARPAPEQGGASAATLAALPDADGTRGRVLRDAQLDRYLRAHREYGAAHPLSLPGGPGRSVETVSFDR
jgi:sigma-E factor negative regulatory protein RseA